MFLFNNKSFDIVTNYIVYKFTKYVKKELLFSFFGFFENKGRNFDKFHECCISMSRKFIRKEIS